MSFRKPLPKNFPSHFSKSKKEEAEFGKGKKDILACPKCQSVYYYKSWRHRLEDYPQLSKAQNLKFLLCPACRMIKNKKYEGEVNIENIPISLEKLVINTIKNMGKTAFDKDPQDRIISLQKDKKNIKVFTTENQLAVRIGKKIKSSFKARMKIVHSKKESITRVAVIF